MLLPATREEKPERYSGPTRLSCSQVIASRRRSDHRGEQLGSLRDEGVSRPATDFIEAFGEPVPRANDHNLAKCQL